MANTQRNAAAVDSSTATCGVAALVVRWAMAGASPRLLSENNMREEVYSAEFRQLVTAISTTMSTISLAFGTPIRLSTVW
ncbi:hypothetical protein D3C81_2078780 [compost metagenome]